ncbi:hypothetical protein [Acidithiobacillus thiooxidans]|uniref:Uncharacterized protein n=1 Tax=Acidithiobacillus thiooxidans TaxID=930 RepID=A0A1C2I1Z2_ACITH|nr:hypothetical protein [Acidithiobacillus thiooxidans]OCX69917.1 hypothetical protein A6M23_14855 [Acidithiobacillus thiooxidans]OCX78966.1 hypothetical protein A6P08_18800 [Acidithiobacillus thiooxidans]
MNAEMIITTSVVAMLDQRNVIKSKVENACQKLCEAMAIELSTTGQRYSNLESFLCGGVLRLSLFE